MEDACTTNTHLAFEMLAITDSLAEVLPKHLADLDKVTTSFTCGDSFVAFLWYLGDIIHVWRGSV